MSELSSHFLLVSLPQSTSIGGKSSLSHWFETSINGGKVEVNEFNIPRFKVGTLDSLVTQSEELAKLDTQLHNSIGKTVDIISSIYEGNLSGIKNSKIVNGKSTEEYAKHFQWNTSRFRIDKPIEELIKIISDEALNTDNDLKNAYSSYNVAKSNLIAAQRKKNGDLSVKSLHDIVKKTDFVLDSEHLTTVLVAVPKSLQEQFESTYEKLVEFVVPRSAKLISKDSEFNLYGVTLFKKFATKFLNAAREQKWIPRDFEYSEEIINNMRDEFTNATKNESTLRNDLIRLSKTAYAEIVTSWFHLKSLRTFIESVLRYGLPPDFSTFLLQIPEKAIGKSKEQLIQKFGYLGGNAFATDKSGKVVKDSSLHEYASLVDTDYEPFVLYEIVLN